MNGSTTSTLQPHIALPLESWHEDMGPVLWWVFPIDEPPYAGTPLDDDWPRYHTHFTPIPIPTGCVENFNDEQITDVSSAS